jgi:hypothetical protein
MRLLRFVIFAALAAGSVGKAADHLPLDPENRLAADAPAWRELAAAFARQPDTTAEFEERRYFPFHREPLQLRGEVRVSRTRGLSLRYTAPDARLIILDQAGVLVREAGGQQAPPDPRASLANSALLNILRFDFSALQREFELFGRQTGGEWSLALVPRVEAVRRAIGNIYVGGRDATVRSIELHRSARQHIDIAITAPRSVAPFSADELKQYFR